MKSSDSNPCETRATGFVATSSSRKLRLRTTGANGDGDSVPFAARFFGSGWTFPPLGRRGAAVTVGVVAIGSGGGVGAACVDGAAAYGGGAPWMVDGNAEAGVKCCSRSGATWATRLGIDGEAPDAGRRGTMVTVVEYLAPRTVYVSAVYGG